MPESLTAINCPSSSGSCEVLGATEVPTIHHWRKKNCSQIEFVKFMAIAGCVTLASCGNLGKSYSQIDPPGAEREIKAHNGYFALKDVAPGVAKLVMRSEGISSSVRFSTSVSAAPCEEFVASGTVVDKGHGVLLPRIAKMTPGRDFVEKQLTPDQPVQVRAHSNWAGTSAGMTSFGSCGSVVLGFTPLANRAYLARFVNSDNRCQLVIEDATNPDVPVAVDARAIVGCSKF